MIPFLCLRAWLLSCLSLFRYFEGEQSMLGELALQLPSLQLICGVVFWTLNQLARKSSCFFFFNQKAKTKKEMTPLFLPYVFSNSPNAASSRDGLDNETGTESVISHRRDRHRRRNREGHEDGESGLYLFPLFHLGKKKKKILLSVFQSSNLFCVSTAEEKCLRCCVLWGTVTTLMEEFGICLETLWSSAFSKRVTCSKVAGR